MSFVGIESERVIGDAEGWSCVGGSSLGEDSEQEAGEYLGDQVDGRGFEAIAGGDED